MAKKKLFTEIVVIMDKSGSMSSLKHDTIGGFNEFLKEQQNVDGKANVSLVQFDTTYNFTFMGVDIKNTPQLNEDTYIPSGMTALLDAVGRGIIETENRIKDMKRKPDQVIFMIITDGYENSSREFTREQLSRMITQKKANDNWQFMFIGADIDSYGESASLGISKGSTANYSKHKTLNAYSAISANMASYRTTNIKGTLDFSDEQLKDLNDEN